MRALQLGLLVAVWTAWTADARAVMLDPVSFPVTAGGQTIGTIEAHLNGFGLGGGVRGNEGLSASFTVTKKKPDGTTMSLAELEASLGQHHLNWFQKVTKDTHPPNDSTGTKLTPPYVDPPSGGYRGPGTTQAWADDRPWYWNETPRPAGETRPDPGQLSGATSGSELSFDDFPSTVDANGPVVGAKTDFVLFLISDFGNKTYQVLGTGVSWSTEMVQTPVIGPGGKPIIVTHLTNIAAGAPFTDEYASEISAFGYTQIPEPATLWLLALGASRLGRRRVHRL